MNNNLQMYMCIVYSFVYIHIIYNKFSENLCLNLYNKNDK